MFSRLRSPGLVLSPGLLHLTRSIAILRPWCVGALLIWSLWALPSAWGLVSHVNILIKSRLMPQCHVAGSAGSGMSRNLLTSRRPNLAQRSSLRQARSARASVRRLLRACVHPAQRSNNPESPPMQTHESSANIQTTGPVLMDRRRTLLMSSGALAAAAMGGGTQNAAFAQSTQSHGGQADKHRVDGSYGYLSDATLPSGGCRANIRVTNSPIRRPDLPRSRFWRSQDPADSPDRPIHGEFEPRDRGAMSASDSASCGPPASAQKPHIRPPSPRTRPPSPSQLRRRWRPKDVAQSIHRPMRPPLPRIP